MPPGGNSPRNTGGAVDKVAGKALTVAKMLPFPVVRGATDIGRKLFGDDMVPAYKKGLSAGGAPRVPHAEANPDIVFFPACVNAMFGGVDGEGKHDPVNATQAFIRLCERAGCEIPGSRKYRPNVLWHAVEVQGVHRRLLDYE